MKQYFLLLFAIFFIQTSIMQTFLTKMIINQPVVNLRYKPEAIDQNLRLPCSDLTNPLQATQLLLGEYIIVYGQYTDTFEVTWLNVDAVEQEDPAQLYPGWIQANQATVVDHFLPHNLVVKSYIANIFDENNNIIYTVSIGTRLQCIEKINNIWQIILPDQTIAYISDEDVYYIKSIVEESESYFRKNIIQTALKFLGNYYSWGGKSAQNEEVFGISSVDCSSLLYVSFIAHGLQIPRMSHEQFLTCNPIKYGKNLQPGDFVFFSSLIRYRYPMDHVLLYIDNDCLLESTFADEHKVRIIPFKQRIGTSKDSLQYGDIVDINGEPCELFFGTYFDQEQLQILRNHALRTDYE